MLFEFIYVHWCPTRFPYQMMFISFNSNTTGGTCGAGTTNPFGAHEFTPTLRCSIFSLLCKVLSITACLFDHFQMAIVFSVLLQFTAIDNPFGIFNFFFHQDSTIIF